MTGDRPEGRLVVRDPRTVTRADHAILDDYSAAVAEEAVTTLTLLRSPMRLGAGLAELHALVSLDAQIQEWIPAVVAWARDQGHTWADIAGQLGVTAATVRRRSRSIAATTIDDMR